jgi:FAD/FMN-containing dehydrogenase
MTSPSPSTDAAAKLAKTFRGRLLQATDQDYEEARRVHNGMVDRRPSLIAQCTGTADVAQAVNAARTLDLEVAVRAGGHNVAGRATLDGGLMIDLSLMTGVHVDPKARRARAQGGVTWGLLDRETQLHGLATTGGMVSTTGIAGLTLGGGMGYLMGKHGLALDNLVSVDIVTSDGRILTASENEHADLFWGIRGAGANFGVVTSLEYRLHPVGPTVTGGLIAYPFTAARDVLRFYRDVVAPSAPDELVAFPALVHAPDGSGTKLVAIALCHCGPLSEGETAVRPIKRLGAPAIDEIGPMTYCELNSMLDADYPRGALNYWRSSFLAGLTDEAIDTMIECFRVCPSNLSELALEHVHGAVTRVGIGDTAFPHRAAGYNFLVLSQWRDPAETDRAIAWARDTYAAMKPFMTSGRYVNYLDHDEAGDPLASAYGPNLGRLQALKAAWDPDNFFHMNQNIRPALPAASRAKRA